MIPLIYLLKVNLAFALFYLVYKAAFTRDTFLGMRRVTLLSMYVIAFVYPFVDVSDWLQNSARGANVQAVYSMLLPEVQVFANGTASEVVVTTPVWLYLLNTLYIIGVAVLLFRTVLELCKIAGSLRRYQKRQVNGVDVCILPQGLEPYSFFKWICLSVKGREENEIKEILLHEQTHASQWHSLDVLLAQFATILCWFNPFVWLLRSELRIVHEYLADKKVVEAGYDKKVYQYHLLGLSQSPQLVAANLYNNFSVLPLKNRIKMLNRKQTPGIMRSKYLFFIPVLAMLVFFSNCQNSGNANNKEPEEVEIEKVEVDFVPAEEAEEVLEEIFEVVEVMPEFPGGQGALMTYLSSNIKYPAEAQEQGTQGRVIVQLVVNKDGSISNIKIVRSVDEALDKEAIRVVEEMPAWTPGMQRGEPVRVKYTIPVTFRLQ